MPHFFDGKTLLILQNIVQNSRVQRFTLNISAKTRRIFDMISKCSRKGCRTNCHVFETKILESGQNKQ